MKIFNEYLKYLKDNPEGYWFKRKLYGYGWTPARPQGWAVIFIYLLGVALLVLRIDKVTNEAELITVFILPFLIITALLIAVSYFKGEPPRWQWGLPKDKEEERSEEEV